MYYAGKNRCKKRDFAKYRKYRSRDIQHSPKLHILITRARFRAEGPGADSFVSTPAIDYTGWPKID